jgi:hypothetical protein
MIENIEQEITNIAREIALSKENMDRDDEKGKK